MDTQTSILLADDEETQREILSLALQERGFRTVEAADGVQALAILRKEKVDVIVSDILMPHMDGYRLCYEVRRDERLKELPFIILTGTYITPSDEKLGMEFGANAYLRKSGSVDEVVDAVQQVIRQAAKPVQRESLEELDVMKEYSERLVGKLEEKNVELERTKDELLKKNVALETMAEALRADIAERERAEAALKQSEGRLRTIFESEPECVKILGRNCILLDINPAGLRMLEADSIDEVRGKAATNLVAPEYREAFEDLTERVFRGETGMLQFEIIGLKGRRRWLETHATPLRDTEGRISQILGVTRDITERKTGEEALKTAEEKYRSIFENAVEGIFQSTREGSYISVNPAMSRMLGYRSPEELVEVVKDIGIQVFVNPLRRVEFVKLLEESGEIRDFEYEARKKDGSKIWVSSNAKVVHPSDGQFRHYEGTLVDITNRKQSEEMLKELTRKVIETQELERKRIARELHDSIGQMLSAVKFRIQSAGEKIVSQKSKVWKDLSDAWTLLEQSIHEVRRVSHNLRPSILDDLGLVSAVRNMCEEFADRTRIKVKLKSSRFPQRLLPEVELSVFRIIQEALNNVEQHSRATHLALQIQKKNSHLMVTIKDNGRGFDPQGSYRQRSKARGFGLEGIRERVSTLGGQLDVRAAANKGVHISIEIPLRNIPTKTR